MFQGPGAGQFPTASAVLGDVLNIAQDLEHASGLMGCLHTGHAEVTQVSFDPDKVSFEQLLDVYWKVHDPTQVDRQGPDVGSQYRAAIVPLTAEQRRVATAYLQQMRASRVWERPIVVQLEAPKRFYPAEEYHQDFARKNPNHPYIRRWDAPKVVALREMYPSLYRATFQTG